MAIPIEVGQRILRKRLFRSADVIVSFGGNDDIPANCTYEIIEARMTGAPSGRFARFKKVLGPGGEVLEYQRQYYIDYDWVMAYLNETNFDPVTAIRK